MRSETPFVADFVGVLNALEVRVDLLEDGVAEMRLEEGQRVRAPLEPGHAVGERLVVAVRPERVRLTRGVGGDASGGSVLAGTVERLVYLGTLTQIHVRTSLGAGLVVHELSGERTADLRTGEPVTLAWALEDATVLRRTGEALAYEAEEGSARA